MKKFNLTTITALAVFGLAACGGAANNTVNTTNANRAATNANSNVAVVVNSNANTTTNTMTNSMSNTGAGNVSSADTEFMNKAAQGGMEEVQLGQMAASKAQNAEVKAFGQKMVEDHSNANTELKAVARQKNVTLPTEISAKQKEDIDKLSKLSGAAFDKEYVKMMVDDHEKDVAEFQKQAANGTNADVKAFAAKTLPTLKMHLDMIKGMQSKIK
jgi:putative membrane protein